MNSVSDRRWSIEEQPERNAWRGGSGPKIRLHVVPMLLGEGQPLWSDDGERLPLTLRSSRRFDDGVVELAYGVGGVG